MNGDPLIETQIKRELESTQDGAKRYRRQIKRILETGRVAALGPVNQLMAGWFPRLVELIDAEKLRATQARDEHALMLSLVETELLAVIVMRTALAECLIAPSFKIPTSMLAGRIGTDVLAEIYIQLMRDHHREEHARFMRQYHTPTSGVVNWYARKNILPHDVKIGLKVKAGAALLWALMQASSSASKKKPHRAFIPITMHRKHFTRYPYIELAPWVVKQIAASHDLQQNLRPVRRAMIVLPREWSNEQSGGYLKLPPVLITNGRSCQYDALEGADLSKVYESINVLSKAAWRINKPVLDVMKRMWRDGGGLLGVPMRRDLPFPHKPKDRDQHQAWRKERRDLARVNYKQQRRRAYFNRCIMEAHNLAGQERFYFPFCIDFRGRYVPLTYPFNHYGGDTIRGLLEFADSGPVDNQELKLHAANHYGLSRTPFKTRIAWADVNMGRIKDAAADSSTRWWREAKHPWQFLATCFALKDGTAHLPVQIDGRCNGLQHHAAMSLDPTLALLTGLAPADRPHDIYATVADTLRDEIGSWGGKDSEKVVCEIDRDFAKPFVMTRVYGSTTYGTHARIREQLVDERHLHPAVVGRIRLALTREIKAAINQHLQPAIAQLNWMRKAAFRVDRKHRRPLAWVASSGLPIVQHYRAGKNYVFKTVMSDLRLKADSVEDMPVHGFKQRQSFYANFIQHLDACHMGMVAIRTDAVDMTLGGVHDSYWTHSGRMPELRTIVPQEFVALHREDQLDRLRNQWLVQYRGADIPALPTRGKFNLDNVLDSSYAFA